MLRLTVSDLGVALLQTTWFTVCVAMAGWAPSDPLHLRLLASWFAMNLAVAVWDRKKDRGHLRIRALESVVGHRGLEQAVREAPLRRRLRDWYRAASVALRLSFAEWLTLARAVRRLRVETMAIEAAMQRSDHRRTRVRMLAVLTVWRRGAGDLEYKHTAAAYVGPVY
jgi:hypothetical protein